MKHLDHRSKRRPMRVAFLITLALIAVALAIWAAVVAFGGEKAPKPNVPGESTGKTQAGSSTTGAPDDTTTAPEGADSTALLAQADLLARGYYYDEAIALLGGVNTDAAKAKAAEYQSEKDALVKYDGTQYYHVFFHSLIIDTSLAFDNKGHPAEGYNMYMTTVSEFQKMLPLFLKNNFVLYDITQMVELKDGKAVPKDIYLPAGKKPLVISIDDVNYYDYMKPDGFADRLDVDADGNVVTIVKDQNGNDTVTYDGDVMPILDAFVKEHPEFSYRGAKGIVALTGYEGAFGYRITDLPDYDADTQQKMLSKVKEVATALRSTGWQIANHSYTHNQYWTNKTMTMDQLKYDTGRWLGEIAPYVGETPIIITPFGVVYDRDDPRFRYIIDSGFYIYCPVGSQMTTVWKDDNMLQSRLNLDGYTMLKHPERVSKFFFDPALVLDPARPPLN